MSVRALCIAALVAACGSSQTPPPEPPAPEPSQRTLACREYNGRITPFLRRFDGALAVLQGGQQRAGDDPTLKSEVLATFADFLGQELPELRAIASADALLGKAHGHLVAAIEEVARGHEQLATAYALGDTGVRRRALDRLSEAWQLWSESSRVIVLRCKEEQTEGE